MKKKIESFYVGLNLRNSKWLVNCSYNLYKHSIGNHHYRTSESLDLLSSDYGEMIFLGGFNVTDDDYHMKSFCENYDLKNLIRQPTCYKNTSNPVCIDLILTNVPCSFQSTSVVETGLPDFHLMTLTVMRKSFKKYQPKIINYRSYKTFSNEKYRETLINNLSKQNFINNNDGFQRFCHISLNKHTPRKKKYARGNQMPFFNKELSTAIMTRIKLRTISLNEKSVVDNKLFWKTVKPLLSDKVAGKDITHLIENNELVKTGLETGFK